MLFICAVTLWFLCTVIADKETVEQTNLILIMFDDLRPELSHYGRSHVISPNFERLAQRSVTFDYAFTHVAVCNPARDAIMTGLRPDSVGTYNFQHSFRPHLSFPTQLARSNYNTAGFGKIFHWENNDREIWNYDSWENDWYKYQGKEINWMNASTMPDRIKREENFRDYEFTTRAIDTLKKMVKEPKHFMLGIGFKLPHTAVHVPYKYYEMYKGKAEHWKLSKKERRFPLSVSEVSYRCCAYKEFQFMNDEGGRRHNRSVKIGDINNIFTDEMHDEMMMGYLGAVTFLDKQIGRLLDVMDELNLWKSTTVILSADHGMHNGEKGIWEKWTLFEEAVRVPLMIAHPLSPYKGQHYKEPVESVDIYATVNEILKLPQDRSKTCKGMKCKVLQGKSLAPVVLGKKIWDKNFKEAKKVGDAADAARQGFWADGDRMPVMNQVVAISQSIRCATPSSIPANPAHRLYFDAQFKEAGASRKGSGPKISRTAVWEDCELKKIDPTKMSVMGYSMRTPDYRYTAYFYYNRTTERPDLERLPYEQELFDHKNETLNDFTHREIINLAYKPGYGELLVNLRLKLVEFIKTNMKFGDH